MRARRRASAEGRGGGREGRTLRDLLVLAARLHVGHDAGYVALVRADARAGLEAALALRLLEEPVEDLARRRARVLLAERRAADRRLVDDRAVALDELWATAKGRRASGSGP